MNCRVFMKEAVLLAEEARENGEVPVGAVIVKDGKIISKGRNRREKEKNALAHAEIEAINKACEALGSWRLDGCEMYVTLEPCPMCTGAILAARLSRVVFGAYDERAGSCYSAVNIPEITAEKKPQIIGGYMEKDCKQLLVSFFSGKRS